MVVDAGVDGRARSASGGALFGRATRPVRWSARQRLTPRRPRRASSARPTSGAAGHASCWLVLRWCTCATTYRIVRWKACWRSCCWSSSRPAETMFAGCSPPRKCWAAEAEPADPRWCSVQLANSNWPLPGHWHNAIRSRDFVEMHGDRRFGDDPAIVGGVGRYHGRSVVVVGHQKGRTDEGEGHAQLRAGPTRGQPEGVPPLRARRSLRHADLHVRRYARRVPGHRCRRARSERGHRRVPRRDGACARSDHHDDHWRRRPGGALALGAAQPCPRARVRNLQRDLA